MISKQSCFTVNAVMSSQEWPILVAMMSAATAGVRCSQLAREKKKNALFTLELNAGIVCGSQIQC